MISLDDMRPAWHRPAGAQQRCLPLRHKRLAKIIDLAKNLDDPIQHHRLHHSAMAAYLKNPNLGFPTVQRCRMGHFKEPSARDRTMRDVFQGSRALGRTVHGARTALGLAVLRNRRGCATDPRRDPSAEPWADASVDGR